MEREENIEIHKIEVDEKTAEPVIVTVDPKTVNFSEDENNQSKPETPVPEKIDKRQLTINSFISDPYDKTVSKRQKTLKIVLHIVFVVICAGILVLTAVNDFLSGKTPPTWDVLSDVLGRCWFYAVFAIVALFFCYFLKGFKLSMLCKYTTGKFHFKTCMETGVVGHYYNSVTPLAVGGQPFEIYHLSRHGVTGGTAAALPIATFFMNQVAMVTLALASAILYTTNALGIPQNLLVFPTALSVLMYIGIAGCLLIPGSVVLISMFPKVGGALIRFFIFLGAKLRIVKDRRLTTYRTLKNVVRNSYCLKKFAKNPFMLIATFLVSLGEQSALCSIAYFSLRFFGFDIPEIGGFTEWLQITQLCMMLYAAVAIFPTPGNSGLAEISFYVLFEKGITMSGLSFAAVLFWRIMSYYSFVIIGFIFTTMKKKA
ncbi:MAG: flippase-like domain-containing protein, partial [Clostridia bacterium]|nr:flippase-like domain-containing protein [Clostridia bacterium]